MGKGSKSRVSNKKVYDENFDLIFRKKDITPTKEKETKQVKENKSKND
jgi:hypothetical protein